MKLPEIEMRQSPDKGLQHLIRHARPSDRPKYPYKVISHFGPGQQRRRFERMLLIRTIVRQLMHSEMAEYMMRMTTRSATK